MSLFNRFTVEPGQVVLEYRNGKLARELRSGKHIARSDARYVSVEMRERLVPVSLQEVLTADAMAIRVSMTLRAIVVDAVTFTERAVDPVAAVYLTAQIALREVCARIGSDELIRRGDAVDTDTIRSAAAQAASAVGMEVYDVVVKDIVVPNEVRAASLEVITAKARGQAQLEAARAETASLRALANAGRLLDAHPALAQLRLVQAAPYGARVVLAVGGAEVPAQPVGE
ncbi:slipin family protein [Gordonia sp. CPCC 205515]|uniref:slipin family protein n=1 Tax=Gordonia sp. CPCC 205515 TaxID=3140791 RepID=UPI003AF3C098